MGTYDTVNVQNQQNTNGYVPPSASVNTNGYVPPSASVNTNGYVPPSASVTTYNPKVPVYVQPDKLNSPTSQLGKLSPDSSFVDPAKATVAGQLGGILSSGSPLLVAAQSQSNQAYNARGLLNSQGGVEAGTEAMIKTALPIAQQDAGLFGNMAQSSQKVQQDAALNNQLGEIENNKLQNNALITGALTQQSEVGKQELQKMSDTAQMQRLQVDSQWKEVLQNSQLDADAQKSLAAVQGQMSADMTGSIERILRDTNISGDGAKQAAISALMKNYTSNVTTTASILSIPISWS